MHCCKAAVLVRTIQPSGRINEQQLCGMASVSKAVKVHKNIPMTFVKSLPVEDIKRKRVKRFVRSCFEFVFFSSFWPTSDSWKITASITSFLPPSRWETRRWCCVGACVSNLLGSWHEHVRHQHSPAGSFCPLTPALATDRICGCPRDTFARTFILSRHLWWECRNQNREWPSSDGSCFNTGASATRRVKAPHNQQMWCSCH